MLLAASWSHWSAGYATAAHGEIVWVPKHPLTAIRIGPQLTAMQMIYCLLRFMVAEDNDAEFSRRTGCVYL